MKTKNCVRCFKPATMWTGHIIYKGKTAIAGWCSDKCLDTKGFKGHYKGQMVIVTRRKS